jgi:small-conductance mechanosensitive channel
MQIQTVKFFTVILSLVVTLATFQGTLNAQETVPPSSKEAADPGTGSSLTISDLVSFSTELSGRLSDLQRNMELGFDLPGFEKDLSETQDQLKVLSVRLKEMKADGRLGYERLSALKAEIEASAKALEKTWKPFAGRIKKVERWSQEWSRDKERLLALESSLPRDESYKTLRPTMVRAKGTIDKAGKLISDNLKLLLAMENKAADVQARSDSLMAEIDGLLRALRSVFFHKSDPTMFSSEYYGQFNTDLWDDLGRSFKFIFASQWGVLQRNLIFIVLLVGFWLISAVMIIRNRAALVTEPRLLFLTERPFAAGVLIGYVAFFPFYEPNLGVWQVVILAAAAFCVARLTGCFIVGLWRRRAVYGIVIVLIINEFLQVSDFPQPLFRLYVLFVSLIGMFLCLWRMPTSARHGEASLYRWALRGGVAVYGMIVVANVSGYRDLAAYLLEASLKTVLIFLFGWILIESGRGVLDRVFKSSSVIRVPLLQKNAAAIVRFSSQLINCFVGAFVTVYLLVTWGVYENGSKALGSVMSLGVTMGSWHVDVSLIITVILCLYGSLLISRAVQNILVEEVFPRRGVERGVQISMGHLIHYAILLVGFLLALATLGLNFTNITIIGGALGVGIGFGLQNIVNNFVSGLILLFERPVRVGDYIEVQNLRAEIKKIGLRATTVETFDRADIVIPNSDLVTNQVTNWTRTNRIMRITIPVGVAYGSDVPLVIKILLECAQDNPSVMSSPKPQVLFAGFGDSSLDFELRVFLLDIDFRRIVHSEILQEIDREFRLNGVEIPFPQRDLHLRSVDDSVISQLPETKGVME